MITRTLLAAAALVAAAACAPLRLAHAQTPARTLTLHITGTKVTPVDLPPLHRTQRSPETAGDVVVARSRVAGAATGARYLHCGVVKPGRGYARALVSCDVTYVLSDGTI